MASSSKSGSVLKRRCPKERFEYMENDEVSTHLDVALASFQTHFGLDLLVVGCFHCYVDVGRPFFSDLALIWCFSCFPTCFKEASSTGGGTIFSKSPHCFIVSIWGFPQMGDTQNGWFMRGKPSEMDDLEVPPFEDTSILLHNLFSLY